MANRTGTAMALLPLTPASIGARDDDDRRGDDRREDDRRRSDRQGDDERELRRDDRYDAPRVQYVQRMDKEMPLATRIACAPCLATNRYPAVMCFITGGASLICWPIGWAVQSQYE